MNGNMNQEMNNYGNNMMNQNMNEQNANQNMMDASLVNPGMMEQNFNEVMMEQYNDNNTNDMDLILKQKIEKREKFDTMLAYALIVILVGCIAAVLILKLTQKEDTPPVNEQVPTYIGLNDISTSLNTSVLADNYKADNATFSSTVSGNSLVVTYVKENTNLNLNIPLIGTELEVTMPEENVGVATEVYKEIASIICAYYGNDIASCRSTLESSSSEEPVNGIRYVTIDNVNSIYINTTRSIVLETVYTVVTKTSINNTDYKLKLSDYTVKGINVEKSDTNIAFSGKIEKTANEENTFSVIVKLYDTNDNLLGENKYEFNDTNKYEENNTFNINFLLNDELKLENIASYSIEISKGE